MPFIYIIRNRTSDLVYVGKTSRRLGRRLTEHRASRIAWTKGTSEHCSSFPIVECPTAFIELLEECEKEVVRGRERWWIENTPNCVNIRRPIRTADEAREYARDWMREKRNLKSAT